MKSFFNIKIRIKLPLIVVIILIIAIIAFSLLFSGNDNPKKYSLYGGLIVGLIIALFQLLLAWYEYREVEKIKELKIKKILPHRDDENLHKSIIQKSTKEIIVLGNTALRFLQDFADSARSDKRALLDAFSRKVKFKLLLPAPEFLYSDDDKIRAKMSTKRILELSTEFKELFECRYYQHPPNHSIVMADQECLIGPIFSHIPSKDCPAIYTDKSSIFVESYLKYFENEWENAQLLQ